MPFGSLNCFFPPEKECSTTDPAQETTKRAAVQKSPEGTAGETVPGEHPSGGTETS